MHQFSFFKFFFSHIFISCDWSDQNFSVALHVFVFRTPDCDNRWCSNYGNTTAIISCRVTVTLQSVHVPVKSIWTGPEQLCYLSSKMIPKQPSTNYSPSVLKSPKGVHIFFNVRQLDFRILRLKFDVMKNTSEWYYPFTHKKNVKWKFWRW